MSFWFIKYCRLSYLLKIYICNCQHSKPNGILNFFVLTVFCPFESATPSPMLSKNYELCKSVQPIVFFVQDLSKKTWVGKAGQSSLLRLPTDIRTQDSLYIAHRFCQLHNNNYYHPYFCQWEKISKWASLFHIYHFHGKR